MSKDHPGGIEVIEWTIALLGSAAKRRRGMDSSFFAAGLLLGSSSKWSLSWIKADFVGSKTLVLVLFNCKVTYLFILQLNNFTRLF